MPCHACLHTTGRRKLALEGEQGHPGQLGHPWHPCLGSLDSANQAFTVVFCIEALLKIIAFGVGGYFGDPYNRFDFFIAAVAVADEVLSIMNLSFLRVFRVGNRCLIAPVGS